MVEAMSSTSIRAEAAAVSAPDLASQTALDPRKVIERKT